jgi:YHS domain-containing protein
MQVENVLYLLLWAGLFFVMMRYGCGAHIMGHGHHHDTGTDSNNGGNVRWLPPDQVVDPVCGMTVQTANAKTAVQDGHVYYFCSENCRQKFEAAPASYAKAA